MTVVDAVEEEDMGRVTVVLLFDSRSPSLVSGFIVDSGRNGTNVVPIED